MLDLVHIVQELLPISGFVSEEIVGRKCSVEIASDNLKLLLALNEFYTNAKRVQWGKSF